MEEKLQRIAKKLTGLFSVDEFKTPQQCYDSFGKIYRNQNVYFKYWEPSDIIKLVIYIYSLKNTGDFKLADSILNRLAFASLFLTQGIPHEKECESCDGSGGKKCYYCGGEGVNNCESCDGLGKKECQDCWGLGVDDETGVCEECEGSGEVNCEECGGDGEKNCYECDGSGVRDCFDCGGDGYVETSELKFTYRTIVTWNNSLKNSCELNAGTMNPVISDSEFDSLHNEYITLGLGEDNGEFRGGVQPHEYYCTDYEDEPNLYISLTGFNIGMDETGIRKYLL